MKGLLHIAAQTDPSKETALLEEFKEEHDALLNDGCVALPAYQQTLFPGSALIFPFTSLGVLSDPHSSFTSLLSIQSSHLLYHDKDHLCFISMSSVGSECTTLFDDGSMVLSVCATDGSEESTQGTRTRLTVQGDVQQCLQAHLRKVLQRQQDGISAVPCNTLKDFQQHCAKDLEGNTRLFWQLFIPNWVFFFAILLILYVISLILLWCANTIPLLSTMTLGICWLTIRWKNRFFQRIDTAMRLDRSFLETTLDLSSRRIQHEFSKLKEALEGAGFQEQLRVKDLLQESIGISNKYAIFSGDEQRTLAYLTLSKNKTLLRGIVNLLSFHSYSNPQCMVSFQTIFSDYASLNSFESFTDTVTSKTGETLHQHELHVPTGTGVTELFAAHQKRMLELIEHTKLQPRTFESAEAILNELEERARKLKDDWADALSDETKSDS